MTFELNAEQSALRDSVRDLFHAQAAPDRLRELWDTETGRDVRLWKELSEIGIPGLLVATEYDGAGATEADLIPVLEDIGRFCIPDAVLESCMLGPTWIAEAGTGQQRSTWLPSIATGSLRVTVRLPGATYVPDAHVADLLIAEIDGELHALSKNEFRLEPVRSIDPSRRLFRVQAAPGPRSLLPDGRSALRRNRQRTRIGVAAMLNGISARLLDDTVDYVTVRQQFDRAVGSFQAVKHLLAEVHAALFASATATTAATRDVVADAAHADDTALLAQHYAIAVEAGANHAALQCHGGIGFTWEHDLHMWLKRGKALELAYGTYRTTANEAAAVGLAQFHPPHADELAHRTPMITPGG